MAIHEFTIIASGLDPQAADFEQRFYDGGCDDATVSFQKGHIIVDFARDAATLEEAIASAVRDVAATGASVDRVEPDPLVSLADIAERTGLSRAAMTQYAKGQRGKGFPPPIARVTSDSPLWDWATVARWLVSRKKVDAGKAHEASVIKAANQDIDRGRVPTAGGLRERVKQPETA
ncbi:helix-turn-helix transcriptional regulator [Phreatobacter oligotrophus]|jgi:predicted DNA-binding transcriptional regulator AlpA|uniref:AlpA family transcriptional regulator n=1 Tax=Phreatobacter oligotrophus TaxID=1122261 RepID=A0A2T4ZF96_9HYPH|nr:hypothetical protein [Phreatobacter oligotrophus]PTM60556.1 hypothetical protein C8P69_103490 [Phreatobacter oligotrophus]